jgi:hypothetical protein
LLLIMTGVVLPVQGNALQNVRRVQEDDPEPRTCCRNPGLDAREKLSCMKPETQMMPPGPHSHMMSGARP